jgi:hypothetical protein
MPEKIRYKQGYKYQLVDPYWYQTDIFGLSLKIDSYVVLKPDGVLYIYRGYAWNGASGPTIDSKSSMRASLLHDALYQMMAEYPELRAWRPYADTILENVCREDGMNSFRAWTWRKAVNWFGEGAATTKDEILEAP